MGVEIISKDDNFLKDLTRDFDANVAKALEIAAQDFVAQMIDRTLAGKDVDGAKFAEYQGAYKVTQGLLEEFESFQELYKFMNGSIEINRLMFELSDIDGDSEEGGEIIKTMIQQDERIMNFLETLNSSKVGELIDTELIDELLLEIVEKINQE